MSVLVQADALDGLLDAFSRCLDADSVRRLSDFQIDPAVQARIDTLAEKANEGTLTDDERSEYQAFIDAADLISIIIQKAERQLQSIGD